MKKAALIVFLILFSAVSCSQEKDGGSIYEKTDKNSTNDENSNTNDNSTVPDNNGLPDNNDIPDDAALPDDSVLPDDNYSDDNTDDALNDEDTYLTDENGMPDDMNGSCGDGLLDEGEYCEIEMTTPCTGIDPTSFTGGDAVCNGICSGWDISECQALSCEEANDNPDVTFADSNCDGIDGNIEKSVFVDRLNGSDDDVGSKVHPVSSINKGIEIALADGKANVLVAAGTYNEAIILADGISVHGGYSGFPDWKRAVQNKALVIGQTIGMTGVSVSNVTVSFLRIQSADNFNESGTSIGVKLKSCGTVQLINVNIESGHGGDGKKGADGSAGSVGENGGYGYPGCENDGGLCDSCSRPGIGSGGISSCGADGGNGGQPGSGNVNGDPGLSGTGSTDNGGSGGTVPSTEGNCGIDLPNGKNGSEGAAGVHGAAGASFGGHDTNGYISGSGGEGQTGINGVGGGGGGGGHGGNDGTVWDCDTYGSSGGGGGAGGCGGTGGKGGTGGGASIGLWIENSTLIVLENISVATKDGGTGGDGGKGGSGGDGGSGGPGGGYGGSGQATGGCGGNGGSGGDGGAGGAGGGGGGGPSIGLVKIGSNIEGIIYTLFLLGEGGPGGTSNGNQGLPGKNQQVWEQ